MLVEGRGDGGVMTARQEGVSVFVSMKDFGRTLWLGLSTKHS